MIRISVLGSFLILLLSQTACASSSVPAISEEEVRIGISPAAMPIAPAVGVCAASTFEAQRQLSVVQIPPSQFPANDLDLAFRLGEPGKSYKFLAQITEESIEIITHSSNSIPRLENEALQGIFSGRVIFWDELGGDGGAIQLWTFSESDEARRAIIGHFLTGQAIASTAKMAISPEHMLNLVQEDRNAIGFLPSAWTNSSVRRFDFNLRLPLLAIAEQEPDGQLLDFLACLQAGEGQVMIAESYRP